MKTVFLFPGQGSQEVDMLKALPLQNPLIQKIFQEAEEVLGKSIYELDSADALKLTVNVQLCLLISGVITARQLMGQGINVDYVAGHSVGAFAAAVMCGTISFKDAIALVALRGQLMHDAYPINYGMAALVGFTVTHLQTYLIEHNKVHSELFLANINSETQLVVAGRIDSIEVLIDKLKKAGIRKTKLLSVSVPSHCKLLEGVSSILEERIAAMQFMDPKIPYASNSTGRLLSRADEVKTDLWKNISTTVRWYDAITLIFESGARVFIEMDPSGVLAKMTHESFPEANILNTNKRSLEELVVLWNASRQTDSSSN